jgi:type IV secretion system protein VirD4
MKRTLRSRLNGNMKNIYTLPADKQKRRGISWNGLGAGSLSLLLTSYAASCYTALTLRLPWPVNPLAWLLWCMEYEPSSDDFLYTLYGILLGGSLITIAVSLFFYYRQGFIAVNSHQYIHGSAHFAEHDEVTVTGLLDGKGVYVGAWQHPRTHRFHYLRHDGPEHIMAFAPTRSGKGVGLVIPTLLSWTESVVVHDIKGENWALTAGWRDKELGSLCLKFDPASHECSVRFNPLEEIRLRTVHEVKDVQNIASMIVDPDGKGLNDHWAKTGFSLLVGTILHVLYAENDKTLRGVAGFLSSPQFKETREIFESMINTCHDQHYAQGWKDRDGQPSCTHPVVAESAKDMLNKAPNELSGVLSTAMSFLSIYRDPIIARNTAVSDFCLHDLMHKEQPVSLYIVVAPSDKDRLKPLVRLLMNQIVRILTEKMAFKAGKPVTHYKNRLLLMIDEFPALGKLDIFAESLAYIAGYGIKAYLIAQDVSQLYKEYGKDESIISNCHIRIAYAPNKIETAELLSKMTGTMTVVSENFSYSGSRLSPLLKSMTASESVTQRPLLTPDETMRLPDNSSLIFVAGHSPIYGNKIRYYADPIFQQRAEIEPTMPMLQIAYTPESSATESTIVPGDWQPDITIDDNTGDINDLF